MTAPVQTISETADGWTAYERMRARRLNHLVVVDARERAVGVLSDRDLRSAEPSMLAAPDETYRHKALAVVRVRDVMSKAPHCVGVESELGSAIKTMLRLSVGCLPVVDRSRAPVGIITGVDLTRVLLRAIEGAA